MDTLPCGVCYHHWPASGSPRAAILLIHGLGEHSARYDAVARQLNERGMAVVAPDHIGHGQSPGHRVFVETFDDYLVGVREARKLIADSYPGIPCYVLGHSMGGLIAGKLLLTDQDQYAGALFSGPAFEANDPPAAPVMWIGRALARLAPKTGMIELDANGVSRDPAVVKAYNEDPLVNHGKVTAALGVAIFDAMAEVMASASRISLPVFILHGGADVMAAPSGSEAFAAAVSSEDKALTILPGLFHEIFNEPEGSDVVDSCADWIEARLP